MEVELFREINGRFLPNELGDPTFYSIYLRKIRLYMIYSNLKNFSLFNFEIFRFIHCYSQILGVSLEPCRRSICLLFQISFIVMAILRRFTVTLYCNIVTLPVITLLKYWVSLVQG